MAVHECFTPSGQAGGETVWTGDSGMGGMDKRSLGSFSVDELGRISLQDGEAGGFGFRWR